MNIAPKWEGGDPFRVRIVGLLCLCVVWEESDQRRLLKRNTLIEKTVQDAPKDQNTKPIPEKDHAPDHEQAVA